VANFSPALKDILANNNCTVVRQGKGSHEIWNSPLTKRNFPVATKILSRHTANEIMKQAGLPKAF